MRCPACGYLSFENLPKCGRCGAPLGGGGTSAGAPQQLTLPAALGPADDLAGRRLQPAPKTRKRSRAVPPADQPRPPRDTGPPATAERPTKAAIEALAAEVELHDEDSSPFHLDDEIAFPDLPPLSLSAAPLAEEADAPGRGAEPIIDRDDEVPECFWAREGAPLGRRSAALAVDLALLAALVVGFFCGALVALRISGFDTAHVLAPAGLKAAAGPLAGLALLLSLSYFTFFHGWAGRTPGKRLAGLEVRTRDGGRPTFGRALLRWMAAFGALAAFGAGIVWALFEPRRLGWADLLSGTMIDECRGGKRPAELTTGRGRG